MRKLTVLCGYRPLFNHPKRDNQGVILITLMWVIIILSLIAWGLSRRSAMEIALVETYRGKVMTQTALRSGVSQLMDWMRQYPVAKDSLFETAVASHDEANQPLHLDKILNDQGILVSVVRPTQGYGRVEKTIYGIEDLGGKINLTLLDTNTSPILAALLRRRGVDEQQAQELVQAIIDFQHSVDGEAAVRGQTRLKPKGRPFESVEELFDVNGMTSEIFDKIKQDVTVFGLQGQGGFMINPCSASDDIIEASIEVAHQNNSTLNAEALVKQAKLVRDGVDGIPFTADDCQEAWTDNNSALRVYTSGYYRAHLVSVDSGSKMSFKQSVILQRNSNEDIRVIMWQRED